jgi:hypothetical protein
VAAAEADALIGSNEKFRLEKMTAMVTTMMANENVLPVT